ncbi:hypothetical protein FQR65_LT20778 [Abscondita terminalis]|nr:hypothetical protein FQR65_LT20778 [Abscondita terminalis]
MRSAVDSPNQAAIVAAAVKYAHRYRTTIDPRLASTGRPAPIAAAIGSSNHETLHGPSSAKGRFTGNARRSTWVVTCAWHPAVSAPVGLGCKKLFSWTLLMKYCSIFSQTLEVGNHTVLHWTNGGDLPGVRPSIRVLPRFHSHATCSECHGFEWRQLTAHSGQYRARARPSDTDGIAAAGPSCWKPASDWRADLVTESNHRDAYQTSARGRKRPVSGAESHRLKERACHASHDAGRDRQRLADKNSRAQELNQNAVARIAQLDGHGPSTSFISRTEELAWPRPGRRHPSRPGKRAPARPRPMPDKACSAPGDPQPVAPRDARQLQGALCASVVAKLAAAAP